MLYLNSNDSFFKNNTDPCHQLILGIKYASVNLKTLHRNIVGKNWYRAHDLLGDFYEKIDEFEDKIVENLMSIGCTDIEIQGNCFLEAKPYGADEALRIAKDILCDLLSLSLDVRNQMPLPSPVAAVFDEFENYIQIEAGYKLDRYLQVPEGCIDMPNVLVNESLSKKNLKEDFEDEIYDNEYYYYTHEEFVIKDGVLIEGPNESEVTIPDGVTSIGEGAFADCTSLTSITIPDSVKIIGKWAFEYCSNLTSMIIPKNVTRIERGVFHGCKNLTEINIPNSVTYIGEEAFKGCESLTEINIPDSVTYIGIWAFDECKNLTSIKYKGKEYNNINEVIDLINNKKINESFFKGFKEILQG